MSNRSSKRVMNSSIIRYILGNVLKIEGALMLLPCLTAVFYREAAGYSFLSVGIFCFLLGLVMTWKKPADSVFYLKEGCIATSLSWIFLSFFGALPFSLSGEIPILTDALFESVSGFSTTGASILSNVEALSHASLIWRSFTQWIGGMGVLVFLLAIIPMSGGSHINLMRAESPGPSVGKLVPKLRHSARILYIIYLGMTLLQLLLLLIGHMPFFDAFAISLSTAGTGGFGIRNNSMAGYSAYQQWITTIFMILFGINFNAYYLILFHNLKKAFSMEEVRYYLGIIAAAAAMIFFELYRLCGNVFDALTHASFQVASIITTSGYSSMDYDTWSTASKSVLLLLMFIGACAGSTGGGIKVSRFMILLKTIAKELNSYIHPKSIKKIKIEGKPAEHEVIRSTNVYFITYMIILAASVLAVSVEGKDLVTTFTAVSAALSNVGPGLGLVGPSQNFSIFTPFSKYILMFDMLAGRLELFPLLILFHPAVWRDLLTHKRLPAKARKS